MSYLSYSDSELYVYNRKKKYPNNYLDQSQSSVPNIFCNNCNNCNNDYNRLQLYFIILVVLFLLSLLGGIFLHIDRKTIIEQNSKILAEYKHHQRLYNNHIDNTIGYIQKMIDLLIKTQGSLSNLKFDVSFDHNYVPDVIML